MQLDGIPSRYNPRTYYVPLLTAHGWRSVVALKHCCILRMVALQVVVTRTVEGPVVRSTYAEVHERSRLCALALRRLGVTQGDRVGTIAWNTCRHLESWSASPLHHLSIHMQHGISLLSRGNCTSLNLHCLGGEPVSS